MRSFLNRPFLNIAAAMSLLLGTTTPLPAEEKGFSCPAAPEPVTSLDYGSRYTDDSKTRSDIDEAGNAEVDKALKPVEQFINELIKMSNSAMMDGDKARAECVLDWLTTWADAGALTRLETMNVELSVPARYAGLAMAMLQAEAAGGLDAGKRSRVVAWLKGAAGSMVSFFDDRAPTNAARNNLRAWAGLAAAAVGRLDGDKALLDWARQSFELVACQASPDGSLPLEMNRADKALNYQLHATAPLIVTADLLKATGYDGYAACGGKLLQIAAFTLRAVDDPAIVQAINGKEQTFQTGKQDLQPYMLAWVEPLLHHHPDSGIDAYVDGLRPLSHAKLGGNLTLIGDWIARLPASNS
jgi:poly(beta-D-mannuronate) lyase